MRFLTLLLLIALLASCSTTRVIKPLQKGQKQVGLSLGGPMAKYGSAPVVFPMVSLSYAQGITDKLTAFGGFHVTSAIFQTIQLDAGINYGFLEPKGARPGISGNLVLNGAVSLRDGAFRLYPELTPNIYWEYKLGVPYIGITNWFDPMNAKTVVQKGQFWIPMLNLGHKFKIKEHWHFDLEFRYIGPNVKTVGVNGVELLGIGGRGTFGIYLGASYTF